MIVNRINYLLLCARICQVRICRICGKVLAALPVKERRGNLCLDCYKIQRKKKEAPVVEAGAYRKGVEEGVYLPEIICSVIRCNVLFLALSSLDFRNLTLKKAFKFPDLWRFRPFSPFLLMPFRITYVILLIASSFSAITSSRSASRRFYRLSF